VSVSLAFSLSLLLLLLLSAFYGGNAVKCALKMPTFLEEEEEEESQREKRKFHTLS
jgi:hypothetical protein